MVYIKLAVSILIHFSNENLKEWSLFFKTVLEIENVLTEEY